MSYKAIYYASIDSIFGYYEPQNMDIDDELLLEEARQCVEALGGEFNTPLIINEDGIQGYPEDYDPEFFWLKFDGKTIYIEKK